MASELSKNEEIVEGKTGQAPSPASGGEEEQVAKAAQLSEFDLVEQLAKERQRADDCFKRMLYLQADFENYRKRVDGELAQLRQFSNEKLISNLLNVVDELELAIRSAKESKDSESLLKGVAMVFKNLQHILEKEGLSKISAVGDPFDPTVHEVVSKVPIEGKADGTILEEVRTGYLLKGKVIRASMVTIASSAKNSPGKNDGGASA